MCGENWVVKVGVLLGEPLDTWFCDHRVVQLHSEAFASAAAGISPDRTGAITGSAKWLRVRLDPGDGTRLVIMHGIFGKRPAPFSTELQAQLFEASSGVISFATTPWKENPFSPAASSIRSHEALPLQPIATVNTLTLPVACSDVVLRHLLTIVLNNLRMSEVCPGISSLTYPRYFSSEHSRTALGVLQPSTEFPAAFMNGKNSLTSCVAAAWEASVVEFCERDDDDIGAYPLQPVATLRHVDCPVFISAASKSQRLSECKKCSKFKRNTLRSFEVRAVEALVKDPLVIPLPDGASFSIPSGQRVSEDVARKALGSVSSKVRYTLTVKQRNNVRCFNRACYYRLEIIVVFIGISHCRMRVVRGSGASVAACRS